MVIVYLLNQYSLKGHELMCMFRGWGPGRTSDLLTFKWSLYFRNSGKYCPDEPIIWLAVAATRFTDTFFFLHLAISIACAMCLALFWVLEAQKALSGAFIPVEGTEKDKQSEHTNCPCLEDDRYNTKGKPEPKTREQEYWWVGESG